MRSAVMARWSLPYNATASDDTTFKPRTPIQSMRRRVGVRVGRSRGHGGQARPREGRLDEFLGQVEVTRDQRRVRAGRHGCSDHSELRNGLDSARTAAPGVL